MYRTNMWFYIVSVGLVLHYSKIKFGDDIISNRDQLLGMSTCRETTYGCLMNEKYDETY